MVTFRNIIEHLETIASKHYMINSFHSGMMDEVDINKLGAEDYVILYAEPSNATLNTGIMIYSFNLYVLDMINDGVGDEPNKLREGRIDTYSENLQILNDVINQFKQNLSSTNLNHVGDATNTDAGREIVLETPITLEPFTARFNNLLTGWSATISLQVNNKNNLCDSPYAP